MSNGFKETRYFVKMKNGETRYFPNEYERKKFETLTNRMEEIDKRSEKKTGSPFEKGKSS